MTEKPYHHGDLRNALIEMGIAFVNENGFHRFSLRKVAALCNVSHTAPYAHFKDIDALLEAMSSHVSTQFTKAMLAAIEGQEDSAEIIAKLGKVYIAFFMEHPNYFQFLFSKAGVAIDLDDEHACLYQPFVLFRDISYRIFSKIGLPPEKQKQLLISNWALVHGIAALATNANIRYSGEWGALLDNIEEAYHANFSTRPAGAGI